MNIIGFNLFSEIPFVGDYIANVLRGISLFLNTLVYRLIGFSYRIFYIITKARIFDFSDPNTIGQITKRIYIVLGVVMLFVFSYSILKLIVDPDKMSSSDDKSLKGIAKNTVISLILVVLLPTIFDFMAQFQERVIDSNVIGNIILASTSSSGESDIKANGKIDTKDAGFRVATTIFTAFFHPLDENGNAVAPADCGTTETGYNSEIAICEHYIEMKNKAEESGMLSEFMNDWTLNQAVTDGKMAYYGLLAFLVGLYAAYMFLSFSFDVGARAIKLIVLQLVAPIPIMLRITKPNGGIFSKWFDEIKSTYLMLFTRIATIYFAIYTISLVRSSANLWNIIPNEYTTAVSLTGIIAELIIHLSILQFAKTAPKLLDKIIGSAMKGEWRISKKLNGEDYEYARRATGAIGTIASNLGRNTFNTLFQRNANGTYSYRQTGKGREFWKNVRNSPNSIIGGAYRGWQKGGVTLDKLGNEIRQASAETMNSIDKHENFRDRIRQNHSITSKIPFIGAAITKADDVFDKYRAAGGFWNYMGNRLNYTTTNQTANEAANFEKTFDSITSYASKGVSDIKDDFKKEASDVRKKYREESGKLTDLETSLKNRTEYSAYNANLQRINQQRLSVQGRSDYVEYAAEQERIKLETKRFTEEYQKRKNELEIGKANLEARRKAISLDTSLSLAERNRSISDIDKLLNRNSIDLNELNDEKIDFDANISTRVSRQASTAVGIELARIDAENEALHLSGIGAEFKKLNEDRANLERDRQTKLDSIKAREKVEIREKVQANLNNKEYRDDIARFFKNNGNTIRENFAILPIDAQKRILQNAGFKTTTPGFNTSLAIEELLKACQSGVDFTEDETKALIGFMDGIKQEQKGGIGNIHMSRITDAISKAKDSGGKNS